MSAAGTPSPGEGPDERLAPHPAPCPWAAAESRVRTGTREDGAGERLRHLGTAAAVRHVLRARGATTQAGFTAEAIPRGLLRRHPILLADGPGHDEQRRAAGRFFAPAHVEAHYRDTMDASAERLVAEAVRAGGCRPEQLALHYAVEVTREAVGLTHAPLPAMSRRLEAFLRQPPFDLARPGLGRTRRQWAAAAVHGLGPLLGFLIRDVMPAVRERRRRPRADLVSHLLAEGCTTADVLVECVTYATAGMTTTREFIVLALWHLLEDPALRERFLAADEADRGALLREIIRLEPVVGHLHRRVQEPLSVPGHADLAPGDLVDLCIAEANLDPRAVGGDPGRLRPGRETARGIGPAGLSFGAGEHRCPGEHLAITETAVLLARLLRERPVLRTAPRVGHVPLVASYRLRGGRLAFPPAGSAVRDDG